jgi:uncharacterized protein YegL
MTKKKKDSKQPKAVKKVTTTTTTVVEETIVEKTPGNTYYAFVVDRSGSMESIKKETIDNFNEQIGTLKGLQEDYPEEKYFITLCLFDYEIKTLYKDTPLSEVKLLDEDTFVPRGSTSLHDAIGFTISDLRERKAKELKKEENEALIVILTDGYENSSLEWKGKRVADLIKEVDAKENWTISFIGASKDSAVSAAETLGIQNTSFVDVSSAEAYTATSRGISNALLSRGYAKSKGVSLKSAMFSSTVDAGGQMSETLDMASLDQLINDEKAKKDKEDKEDKA